MLVTLFAVAFSGAPSSQVRFRQSAAERAAAAAGEDRQRLEAALLAQTSHVALRSRPASADPLRGPTTQGFSLAARTRPVHGAPHQFRTDSGSSAGGSGGEEGREGGGDGEGAGVSLVTYGGGPRTGTSVETLPWRVTPTMSGGSPSSVFTASPPHRLAPAPPAHTHHVEAEAAATAAAAAAATTAAAAVAGAGGGGSFEALLGASPSRGALVVEEAPSESGISSITAG